MFAVINGDKSSRNTSGTQNSATKYPDPLRAPPKATTWVINLCNFDLGRPVTLLTTQAWPNRPIGPPKVAGDRRKATSDRYGRAETKETTRLNTGKSKGGWRPKRQLNDTQSLRAPSSIELGRA
jgi:hypothetical protein